MDCYENLEVQVTAFPHNFNLWVKVWLSVTIFDGSIMIQVWLKSAFFVFSLQT
jgi:hypothetical protein